VGLNSLKSLNLICLTSILTRRRKKNNKNNNKVKSKPLELYELSGKKKFVCAARADYTLKKWLGYNLKNSSADVTSYIQCDSSISVHGRNHF
jgi:hypothetical protein